MKHYIIFIITILTVFSAEKTVAQRALKYKNVFEVIQTGNNEAAYPLLLKFQRAEPKHANTYYWLGEISLTWIKKYDPFYSYTNLVYFWNECNTYYGLARLYSDESTVKDDRDYFVGVQPLGGNKIEFTDAQAHIEKRMAELQKHKENTNRLRQYLFASANHYKQSVETFKQIITFNNKEKDLFMSQDPELIEMTEKLRNSFDSTMWYFDQYKKVLAEFPVQGYNQEIKLKKVETYRLQGLLPTNFLQPTIELWDYGTWVNELLGIWNNDVSVLRKNIMDAHLQMNSEVNSAIKSNRTNEKYQTFDAGRKLINQIEKYDYGSIMSVYFRYMSAKVNFYRLSNNIQNNPAADSVSPMLKTVKYYNQLVEFKQEMDSLNNLLGQRVDKKSYIKYKEFFDRGVGGLNGLENLAKSEAKDTQKELENSFENLKTYLFRSLKSLKASKSFIKFSATDSIPFYANTTDSLGYLTANVIKVSKYFMATGALKSAKRIEPFIAASTDTLSPVWVKRYPDLFSGTPVKIIPHNLLTTTTGWKILFTAVYPDQTLKSVILTTNRQGNKEDAVLLATDKFPRFFYFDDITETYTIVTNGKAENIDVSRPQDMTVSSLDLKGNVIWEKSIMVAGAFADAVKSDKNWLVFFNFTEYKSSTGIVSSGKNNQTNLGVLLISTDGAVVIEKQFISKESSSVYKVIKTDSENLIVLGLKDNYIPVKQMPSNTKPLLYMVVNPMAEKKYSN